MTKLEEMKIRSELARVTAAMIEQEYNIEQRKDEISRLEASIKISKEKITELEEKLKQ